MIFNTFKNTVLLLVLLIFSCGNNTKQKDLKPEVASAEHSTEVQDTKAPIIVAANQTEIYLPKLKDKRIGIVANQTSVIFNKKGYTHIVDSLLALGVNLTKVLAPEHGFRGKSDAGELLKDGVDTKTGLPIISIYGKSKKPSVAQLKNLDLVVFDIQDVGARFYTYISHLHYLMEACAEQNIPILILDRPNPNGNYIDGPILEPEHKSFIGMHPIPVVHGMTIGEYAKMINGEQWLKNGINCDIDIITVKNYKHTDSYNLPIKPSPNLPNDNAINLYPSLCFFEGTNVSVGRGTDKQFQVIGSPDLPKTDFSFTPKPNEGAKQPKNKDKVCYGIDLSGHKHQLDSINITWLINAYNTTSDKSNFFLKNKFIYKLAGTKKLQQQIEDGWDAAKIKATWQSGLKSYSKMRKKYLLYSLD